MLYILTEEEYKNLTPLEELRQTKHFLQIVTRDYLSHSKNPDVFPCLGGNSTCDSCPIFKLKERWEFPLKKVCLDVSAQHFEKDVF